MWGTSFGPRMGRVRTSFSPWMGQVDRGSSFGRKWDEWKGVHHLVLGWDEWMGVHHLVLGLGECIIWF